MGKSIDLTGQRYGRLTVVCLYGRDKHGGAIWLCKCDCGNDKITTSNHLRTGQCKSCGCLHAENAMKIAKMTKHGGSGTRLYSIYNNMLTRCYNPNAPSYSNYGARGITVCDEWRNDFKCFHSWALSNGYANDLTIERKDVDGKYEPSNCCWVSKAEQARNTTRTRYLTYNNKTQSMKQWADEYGISYRKLKDRINKLHWSTEKSLNTP